ncbi:MAG: hypothetical protein GF330_08120 [Candidatus Eisenbacteria bacterium]|nr:hypothetical protein [Candidatus Eisenbacteria bacterium]
MLDFPRFRIEAPNLLHSMRLPPHRRQPPCGGGRYVEGALHLGRHGISGGTSDPSSIEEECVDTNTTGTQGLGDMLIREGLIGPEDLEHALAEQKETHERLGEILCRRGQLTPQALMRALAHQLQLQLLDPRRDVVQPEAIELIPVELARRHGVLPVRLDAARLTVAVSDPLDVEALDALRAVISESGRELDLRLALPETIRKLRDAQYARASEKRDVAGLIDRVVYEVGDAGSDGEADETSPPAEAQDGSIVSLVDRIISQAVRERATDIHIEPQVDGLLIRYRIDGLLRDALEPPRAVYTGIVSRLKILAEMDIAEKRAPQDGRFSYRIGGREVDVRASVIPTIHGEKLVLRLLDKSSFRFTLAELGFSEANHILFRRALRRPYGMILLSGPTGSGKSTTLYAGLLELRDEVRNIVTVEDPVEYQMARINQVQVNAHKDVVFAKTLRHFLRQDPDVIMVGEIRDEETADVAVRAALTGHLVLSTIHANDAPSTALRLVSMGLDPHTASSALTLVAAQRLVRRNCPHCLESYEPEAEVRAALRLPDGAVDDAIGAQFRRGAGCAECQGRGYHGRVAVVEMMALSPSLRKLVAGQADVGSLRRLAIEEGMRTLRQDGLRKVQEGVTTLEEVLRVCLSDDATPLGS